MRLAQLSRKLGLKTSEIQSFLATNSQPIDGGPNTRLTDDQVLLVVRHFAPSQEQGIFIETATPEPAADPVRVEDLQVQPEPQPDVDPTDESIPADETGPEVLPEVIRAPKQELPGLKVVGKIELKEPKKKDSPEPGTPSEEQRPDRPARPIRREQPQRTCRNPLEAQRQREIEEREERRRQELERQKALKTQKYLKKVKSMPTKPARRQEETVVETQVETRPAPKTWLGKIARWLTT